MVDSLALYGQAMLSHLAGRGSSFYFERDDGYRDLNDVAVLFRPFRDWPGYERRAIRWAKGRVLDVGCGPGRVALYLQGRGLAVTAIDASAEAVECAKRRGVEDARRMDARQLEFPPRTFDSLVMFGNNFGICGDFAATRRFLRRARLLTKPGARLIGTTRTPGSWKRHHAKVVLENVRHGRPPGLIRLRVTYRGVTGSWFPLLFASPDDVLRLCQDTGWSVVTVLADGDDIEEYAFVAERT